MGGIEMKFWGMTAVNCKRYFKDIKNIVLMFLLPIACILLTTALSGNNNKASLGVNVAYVNLDKGSLGKEIMSELGVNSYFDTKENALRCLKNYDFPAIYVIPEDFSEDIRQNVKPTIESYKLEEGNTTAVFENNLEDKINTLLTYQTLRDKNIIGSVDEIKNNIISLKYNIKDGLLSAGSFFPIVLILYFMLSFSSSFGADLLVLRNGKVLERFLATNNRGYKIMGSIYLSMLLVQTILYSASFTIANFVFKYRFENFGILLLNVVAIGAISISLAVMMGRMFKDPGVVTMVITLVSLVLFFTYVGGIDGANGSGVAKLLYTVSKFTPLYWAMDSIERSIIFPNIFILILMAFALFSAGSIKFSTFAKKA
jgi:ABC-2 type transport system permease protein